MRQAGLAAALAASTFASCKVTAPTMTGFDAKKFAGAWFM